MTMTKKEFKEFLKENRKSAEKAMREFDEHSRRFDEIMREIRAGL